ncbi:hypothetical protein ACFSKW_39155 [Nonomuraea mangrovi]|uniref:Uncharacterized protein n=1 Tax=Nonomuraea mangrovi TaxID=2316207 RepID=A0ABW4T8I2_9ACTN
MYLPDRVALERLADALMETLHEQLSGRGEVVIFAAGTVARIGEVFGVRVCDIDAPDGDLDRPCPPVPKPQSP